MAEQRTETEEDRILEEAAVWFMRLEAGETSENSPDYRAWLEASDAHQDAMARARITWGVLGDHAKSPELTKARSDALARSTDSAARRWQPLKSGREQTGVRFGWRAPAIAAVLVVGLIAVPVALLQFSGEQPITNERPAESARPAPMHYATDVAETRVVTLPDNSRISIDAATQVSVSYTAAARDITLLAGQAHFNVAKDATRPFRVTAGDRTVVAIGTAFNIEMIGDEVLVTLLEGEVIVTDARSPKVLAPSGGGDYATLANSSTPVKLEPGQQLLAVRDNALRIDAAPNIEKTTAWRQGKVFLEEDILPVAVARMNRYSRISLVVADDSLNVLEIGGIFNAGDTDAFIEALEAAFPIEARRMSASLIELHPRS